MIINSDTKIPIERHFRIVAGPGAGKTHWLINHINNVLQTSKRLMRTRKIACITYTNIGVDTILNRLGRSANQVEVSTIHSFLYRHIVKPYASFLPCDFELNVEKLDGHDDTIVNFKIVLEWLEKHPRVDELKNPYSLKQLTKLPENKKSLINWLYSLNYKFDENNKLCIVGDRTRAFLETPTGRRGLKKECSEILESDLLEYKKFYWRNGLVDHNDILFFSYKLIEEHPFILTILRAKFPYFFVDEFQDTNPIQTKILGEIGRQETVVGVIGDQAQSIYSFQGASLEHFVDFFLPNIVEYALLDNRRSTNQIIDILNSIRTDIQQNKYRDEDGQIPTIFVGNRGLSYIKVKEMSNNEDIYSLSRDNITSNAMKKEVDNTSLDSYVIDKLLEVDRSSHRKNMIVSCISAVELARYGRYREAIKKIEYFSKIKNDKIATQKLTLERLYILLNSYDLYKDKSLMEFYDFIKINIDNSLSIFRKGAGKTFYETHSYQQLSLCVNIIEDTSKHKTIHKSKGDEFDNVILITNESNLDFLLSPNLIENEEHRVYYVAISRARERLFINVPTLSEKNETKLKELFQIIRI